MIDSMKLQKIEELLTNLLSIMYQKNDTKSMIGIITQKELLAQLNIAPNTLKKWENLGLNRLEPPIDGTRCVFYEVEEVIRFLAN